MRLPIKEFIIFGISVSIIGIGGVHPWVNLVSFFSFFVAILMIIYKNMKEGRELQLKFDNISIFLLLLVIINLFYLIPLPVKLLSLLSERYEEIWGDLFSPLDKKNNFGRLSLDPAGSFFELNKISSAFLLYLLISWWVKRYGSQEVLLWFTLLGICVLLIGLFHYISGIEKVYGLYRPKSISLGSLKELRAPFLNPNHEGGFLLITSLVTLGLAIEKEEIEKKFFFIFISGLIGCGIFLTFSKGAISCYIGGIALFFILYQFKLKEEFNLGKKILVGFSFIISLVSAVYLIWNSIIERYSKDEVVTKLVLWKNSLKILKDFSVLGIGRGAFETVFPYYWRIESHTFTHPESFLIQYLTEYGILIGGIIIVCIVYILYKFLREKELRGREIGVLSAVVAIFVHNLVDFNLELSGILFIVVSLIAILNIRSIKVNRKKRFRFAPYSMLFLVVALFFINLWGGYFAIKGYLPDVDSALSSLLNRRGARTGKELSLIKKYMELHPADYYIPYIGGIWCYYNNPFLNPLKWFSRSLQLNPDWSGAHFWIGKLLWEKGLYKQAGLEFKIAIRNNRKILSRVFSYLIDRGAKIEDIILIAKEKEEWLVELIKIYLDKKRYEDGLKIAEYLYKNSERFKFEYIKMLYINKKYKEAEKILASVKSLDSKREEREVIYWAIKIYSRLMEKEKIKGYIEEGLKKYPTDIELLHTIFEYYIKIGEYKKAREILNRLKGICFDQLKIDLMEAKLEFLSHNYDRALILYQRIYNRTDSTDALRAIARLYELKKSYQLAIFYYKKLLDRIDSKEIRDKLKKLKKLMEEEKLKQLIK